MRNGLFPGSLCKRVESWRSWRDLIVILKSLYQSQSCVAQAWVHAIKWGHPSASLGRHPNPLTYRLFVKLLSQCAIENPLDSIMHCAGLLCSVFQYVSRSPRYYCSVSVYISHPLFVSKVINTEQILSVNQSVVLFKLVILHKRFSPLVRHVSFTT